MSKLKKISLILLCISLLISIFLYIISENKYSRVTFQFYHELEHRVVYEDRSIILNGSREENAKTIVEELFLGPISVFNHKIVPYDMKFNIFYIDGKTAYLDMPLEFITEFNETFYEFEDAIILIEDNILNNIPGINKVVITIDGETMGVGPSKNLLPQDE